MYIVHLHACTVNLNKRCIFMDLRIPGSHVVLYCRKLWDLYARAHPHKVLYCKAHQRRILHAALLSTVITLHFILVHYSTRP